MDNLRSSSFEQKEHAVHTKNHRAVTPGDFSLLLHTFIMHIPSMSRLSYLTTYHVSFLVAVAPN